MEINLVNFNEYNFNNAYKPAFCGHSISLTSSGSDVPSGQKQYFIDAFIGLGSQMASLPQTCSPSSEQSTTKQRKIGCPLLLLHYHFFF